MGSLRCWFESIQRSFVVVASIGAIACTSAALPCAAQESGTRGVTPEEFIKARPAKAGAKTATHSAYKLVGAPLKGKADTREMGITIWRLRPSRNTDGGPRILVQEGPESVSWTPERVAAGTRLRMGDRVRLTIESPRSGYLYVIDREQYATGELGEPYLIFPTTRINNGDNKVSAGKIIDLPAQEDRPNYFTLCGATVTLSDGRDRSVWYLIEEGQGFASIGNNVEFCVAGFDRWLVYNGRCRVLR